MKLQDRKVMSLIKHYFCLDTQDNLNLFFKACERLGLKRLHLFDTTDLQEVTSLRGESM